MVDLLKKEFGFTQVTCTKLDGYDNLNYLVTTENGKYVFKTYTYSEDLWEIVLAENDVLATLEANLDGIPKPIPFADGQYVKSIEINGEPQICRMLTFLEGKFLGDVEVSKSLYQSLGHFLAKLDLKFQEFSSPSIRARQWGWDLQYLEMNRKYIDDISSPHDRNVVRYFFQQFRENVVPRMSELRKQVIHNDANEWNILVQEGEVFGIIDFGDVAHSFMINELAIAIVYGCYDKEHPLEWACVLLEAYHQTLPLEELEVEVLYYLVAARLCISVCNSAHAKKNDPENTYASVSEDFAWKMLHKWLAIGPVQARNHFRKPLGFTVKKVPVEKTILERREHISPVLSMSYERPIHMVGAAFQYMYDASGNTFLDAYNNIPHVGHSHPKVVNAGQRQMARLNTNTRYLYDQLAEYAGKLLKKFPAPLNKVFFVNSGSAASDLAIRMAKFHTGYDHIMVMETGYHGNTQIGIEISDYKFNNPKGEGQKANVVKTKIPDTYKGKFADKDSNPGQLFGKEAVRDIESAKAPLAAFICEPIVGCAGQVPLPSGYLKEVYPAIRKQGGVCISDEVQTGFGRVGDYFWGFQAQGVVPDIVVLGKPIANGHPMGAVVCTEEIAASFEQGVEFFSSFGGNPVSCAIASAVLDVIEEEGLQENAQIVGDYYQSLLKELMPKYPCIGDVRGSGLFIGVEIVEEGTTHPNTALAQHIKNALRERHILISTDGKFDNVIKTKPPLCFTKDNAQSVVTAIDEVLSEYYGK